DGGRASITVIGVQDLCKSVDEVLRCHRETQYNLYYEDAPTMRELLHLLRKIIGRHVLFFPVPATCLLLPLSVLRRLRIRTPIDADNLKGYVTSLAPYHPTNLRLVLPHPTSLEAALREAWGREVASAVCNHGGNPTKEGGIGGDDGTE